MSIAIKIKRIAGLVYRRGLVTLACLLLLETWSFADAKKDISDPVLQEIVQSFASRMPRFIDKHGLSLFVADEPVTRGSLMLAIYEYDKSSNKQPKKEYISKQEFDEFRNKLALRPEKTAGSSGKLDIGQLINELEPNMGVLLDSSLANSRVFMSLKNAVDSSRASGGGISSADRDELVKMQAGVSDLERRLETIEKTARSSDTRGTPQVLADGVGKQEFQELRNKFAQLERNMAQINGVPRTEIVDLRARLAKIENGVSRETNNSAEVPEEMRGDVAETQKEVERLGKRLDAVERKEIVRLNKRIDEIDRGSSVPAESSGVLRGDVAETQKEVERLGKRLDNVERKEIARLNKKIDEIDRGSGASSESSGELRQYASALTKITLGLGMVAAFFIAR